ncbi:hypothetical protein CKO35_07725 [Ectothiorhodospira shaposhnikovii]|nr:hypothetical protein [Ectothiorhodospira shaposhnikovii]
MSMRTLTVHLHGYWRCGSGQSGGTHLDTLTSRDGEGLPMIPGRHLKGLLRHAMRCAQAWNWLDGVSLPDGPVESVEELLFGSLSGVESRYATRPGMLLVDDAAMPEAERAFLVHPDTDGPQLRPFLYRDIHRTAINRQGSASDKTLRGAEVVLPMRLEASLSLEVTSLEDDLRRQQECALGEIDLWGTLKGVLPLISAIGAERNRGLGEAALILGGPS